MGSTSLLEVEAVEPLDPRHRDPHAEVVLLLGKVAEVVALVDLRLHVVGVDLSAEVSTSRPLGNSAAMRSIAARRTSSLNTSTMPANQNNDRSVKSVAKV